MVFFSSSSRSIRSMMDLSWSLAKRSFLPSIPVLCPREGEVWPCASMCASPCYEFWEHVTLTNSARNDLPPGVTNGLEHQPNDRPVGIEQPARTPANG